MMLKILSPYDQSLIKEIPLDGKDAVNQTIKIAHDLFQDIPNWLPAYQRINILEKTGPQKQSTFGDPNSAPPKEQSPETINDF